MKKKLLFVFLCLFVAAICVTAVACRKKGEEKPTEGLRYEYNEITDSYQVSAGEAKEEKHIVIARTYEGKPVTAIADHGFVESAAESIVLPASITTLGMFAFAGCSGLTSIALPASVTSIGEWAFGGCSSLPSITIPASITYIGDRVFYDCVNLPSITIPASVTYIGDYAFRDCANLRTVTFAGDSQLKTIDFEAFYNCSSLTEITIPENVTTIGYCAFSGCGGLKSISVAPGNNVYSSQDGILYNYDQTEIICVPGGKQSVTIPVGVTSIYNGAFFGCSNFTSITIPASVTSIGEIVFCDCCNLQTVEFEETDGWKVSSNSHMSDAKDILSSDLQDQEKAAQYLCDTYCSYYWQRA